MLKGKVWGSIVIPAFQVFRSMCQLWWIPLITRVNNRHQKYYSVEVCLLIFADDLGLFVQKGILSSYCTNLTSGNKQMSARNSYLKACSFTQDPCRQHNQSTHLVATKAYSDLFKQIWQIYLNNWQHIRKCLQFPVGAKTQRRW